MVADSQAALIDGLLVPRIADDLAITPRERTLLSYAEKLTTAPSTITRTDVASLRAQGLDDRAIHDACAIIAYFAFVNRIADGLGVEQERDAGSAV